MSNGKFFASRSAEWEKKVNASCQSGCSARSVSSTGLACSPSPTDGACIQISGRFVSRCAAAHAARRAANPRRPSSPRATFLSKRATSGAARVTTCTLSRYRNEGLITARARTHRVDRIQHLPHRIGRVGCSFEQAAFYIEGRSHVSARSAGPLGVELDFLARASLGDTGEQLCAVGAGALRDLDERVAGLCELGPVVLSLVERIVRGPKTS